MRLNDPFPLGFTLSCFRFRDNKHAHVGGKKHYINKAGLLKWLHETLHRGNSINQGSLCWGALLLDMLCQKLMQDEKMIEKRVGSVGLDFCREGFLTKKIKFKTSFIINNSEIPWVFNICNHVVTMNF